MASPAMHVAVAKKYIEKHNNLNYKEFIKGTLYPDAETNSIKLHYPKSFITSEFAIGVYDKVNLYAFLTDYPSEYYPGIPYEECLLSKELVDDFIKRTSSIDLDRYIDKILKFGGNIKP